MDTVWILESCVEGRHFLGVFGSAEAARLFAAGGHQRALRWINNVKETHYWGTYGTAFNPTYVVWQSEVRH